MTDAHICIHSPRYLECLHTAAFNTLAVAFGACILPVGLPLR
jgi:hypothetical protein